MAEQIYVRPAREGLLVAYSPHKPGRYIGVRRARKGETPHHQVHNGHGYVTSVPERMERTAYVQRRIQHGELLEVPEAEALAAVADAKAARKAADEAQDEVDLPVEVLTPGDKPRSIQSPPDPDGPVVLDTEAEGVAP
jgi:hypothetical protein